MRLISKITGVIDELFRVPVAESDDLRLRAVKQQDLLDRLRTMPEFGVLLDAWDGELRVLLRKFFAAETEADALAVCYEARAFTRMQARMELGVNAKSKGAAMEEAFLRRQTELLKVDQLHSRQNLEAQAQQGQNGRYGRP